MAYTVYEFDHTTPDGLSPVHPAAKVTQAVAYGAPFPLRGATKLAQVVPDANTRMRVSHSGAAAVATDYLIPASALATIACGADDTGATRPLQLYGIAG